jgi:hypothetical protein
MPRKYAFENSTKLCFLLYVLCLSLSGCVSNKKSNSQISDFEPAGCLEIAHQNITDKQWQAVKEASSDVCFIFHSTEFKDEISTQTWLASCEKKHGKADSISGLEIFKLISGSKQRFTIYAHKLHNAEAETDNDEENSYNNRITIDPGLIDSWYSSNDTIRSQLINVIAHEYIHLLSDRFLDYDGDAPRGCNSDILISYGVGDITESLWLKGKRK